MQTPSKKDKTEIFLERLSAKKQKIDVSVIQRNFVATKLSVKLSSTVNGWVDHKEIVVRKVYDNNYVDLENCEDDETSNDAFVDFFVNLASSEDTPPSNTDAVVNTPPPLIPDASAMFESHPCVRQFPFRVEGFEWIASAESLEDIVTFQRVLSTGKTVETSYVPLIIKPDLPEPVPQWVACTAYRQYSPQGDDSCGDRGIGVSACCDDQEVYCLGHMPHWVHTMCAEDYATNMEKQRRDEEEYIRDPEAYERNHPPFEFHYDKPEDVHQTLCNCYCSECA